MFVLSATCGGVCTLFFLPQRPRIKDGKRCEVSLSSQSSILFGQMPIRGDTVENRQNMRMPFSFKGCRRTESMPSPLESIRHLSETLFQYSNVDDMVRQVLRTALDVIGADAGSILLADEKN